MVKGALKLTISRNIVRYLGGGGHTHTQHDYLKASLKRYVLSCERKEEREERDHRERGKSLQILGA